MHGSFSFGTLFPCPCLPGFSYYWNQFSLKGSGYNCGANFVGLRPIAKKRLLFRVSLYDPGDPKELADAREEEIGDILGGWDMVWSSDLHFCYNVASSRQQQFIIRYHEEKKETWTVRVVFPTRPPQAYSARFWEGCISCLRFQLASTEKTSNEWKFCGLGCGRRSLNQSISPEHPQGWNIGMEWNGMRDQRQRFLTAVEIWFRQAWDAEMSENYVCVVLAISGWDFQKQSRNESWSSPRTSLLFAFIDSSCCAAWPRIEGRVACDRSRYRSFARISGRNPLYHAIMLSAVLKYVISCRFAPICVSHIWKHFLAAHDWFGPACKLEGIYEWNPPSHNEREIGNGHHPKTNVLVVSRVQNPDWDIDVHHSD